MSAQTTYVVTASGMLNVRKLPSSDAQIIGKLSPNQEITVYTIEDNWAVITYNDHFGYVASRFIAKKVEKTEPDEQSEVTPIDVVESTSSQITGTTGLVTSSKIVRQGNTYYLGSTKIANDYTEFNTWMKVNNPYIYSDYQQFSKRMDKMWHRGLYIGAIGLGCLPAGIGLTVGGGRNINSNAGKAGIAFLVIGPTLICTGIPILSVGLYRFGHNTLDSWYNEHTPSYVHSSLELELKFSGNAVGLALNF